MSRLLRPPQLMSEVATGPEILKVSGLRFLVPLVLKMGTFVLALLNVPVPVKVT